MSAYAEPGDPEYCLSICSADFNEWIRKNVSSEDRYVDLGRFHGLVR